MATKAVMDTRHLHEVLYFVATKAVMDTRRLHEVLYFVATKAVMDTRRLHEVLYFVATKAVMDTRRLHEVLYFVATKAVMDTRRLHEVLYFVATKAVMDTRRLHEVLYFVATKAVMDTRCLHEVLYFVAMKAVMDTRCLHEVLYFVATYEGSNGYQMLNGMSQKRGKQINLGITPSDHSLSWLCSDHWANTSPHSTQYYYPGGTAHIFKVYLHSGRQSVHSNWVKCSLLQRNHHLVYILAMQLQFLSTYNQYTVFQSPETIPNMFMTECISVSH